MLVLSINTQQTAQWVLVEIEENLHFAQKREYPTRSCCCRVLSASVNSSIRLLLPWQLSCQLLVSVLLWTCHKNSLSTLFISFFICKRVLVFLTISSQHSDTVQLNFVVEYAQKWTKHHKLLPGQLQIQIFQVSFLWLLMFFS